MKHFAPAAERNKEALLDALRDVLPSAGTVLEVASGSGQHAVHFARAFPELTWQPSDATAEALASIEAYRSEAALPNLAGPLLLDASHPEWPIRRAAAVVCINMIHIAPWSACLGLLDGAARLLPSGAPLILYGPYSIDGDFTAPSNLEFDRQLRSRDPSWGIRELRDVQRAALERGLHLDQVIPRPANNHVVVLRRGAGTSAT